MRNAKSISVIGFCILLFAHTALGASVLPKYGPNAVPLSLQTNTEYLRKHKAPDFWALIPYYLPQNSRSNCSAANFAMVLNAARNVSQLTAADQIVTIENLTGKYTDERYKNAMTGNIIRNLASLGSEVANTRLTEVLKTAVEKLGMNQQGTEIKLFTVDQNDLKKSRKVFHDALVENEKTANDFMIISFVQGTLTGDPEGGSHVATIGAYDEQKKLVLIMDPDREWYEPYWSPENKVFDAIQDPHSDGIGKHPGWIYYKIKS